METLKTYTCPDCAGIGVRLGSSCSRCARAGVIAVDAGGRERKIAMKPVTEARQWNTPLNDIPENPRYATMRRRAER